jgi:hypothetical protein
VVLASCGLVASFMQTLVVPLIPVFPRLLNASPADASWVVTVTLLAASVITPVSGRLGDLYGKRRMILVTLAQPGQEPGHVLGGHLGDVRHAPRRQRLRIAPQVPAVGLQRVRGQAALDHQVVEIALGRALDAGGRDGFQLSASLAGVQGRPCASPTLS